MAQPLGDRLQQFVADEMAKRVVDGLEVVEVKKQHRQLMPAPDPAERILQAAG